jgi:hypothetical protein
MYNAVISPVVLYGCETWSVIEEKTEIESFKNTFGSLVTTAWRVLRLWMEEKAS